MKFKGIRYKLYIAALDDSGTIELLSVPMVGKYIPTVISKMFIAIKVKVSSLEKVMRAMAIEAAANKTEANDSNFTFFSIAIEKVDEPYYQRVGRVYYH
jgi:nitric oxide synthase oxygenase domain/subunit